MSKSTLKSILNVTGSQCKDWCDVLRISGSSQNPGSSVLDELQLSNGFLWKASEETITIIHHAGDKGMNMFLQIMTGNKTTKLETKI